jgi:hypothetical protein
VCCKQLREKLSEYQAENSLLGTLVKELKVRKRQQNSHMFHMVVPYLCADCQGILSSCDSSSPALQEAVLMLSTPCHPACAASPLQVERDGLQKKLASVAKQHSDASSRAATAQHQVDAVGKDQKRLAAEVERLSSVVHSHSVRLQK